ncbi:MAG: pyridoxamine 5'-phosphate oxidase family protein [Acidimicrobiales bacterium]
MSFDPSGLPDNVAAFLAERHLAILTTVRPDGALHACAVGFTYDQGHQVARVICSRRSIKARNAERGCRAVVAQVDGLRWLSLEGTAIVRAHPAAVDEAVRRYAQRYRTPADNPERVVIEISVDRILGRA